ncbi:choice-of-anchor B family protein [Aestuariivivens sediminicola]|uniref:choice-of-anchor B family protein n=1 Tax=Aestuariivivens sediminicola TaxID=2913560 RepID=UPI001F576795|nr:choice-of-anchor B family protein [Aestuariivivens sediminicola]
MNFSQMITPTRSLYVMLIAIFCLQSCDNEPVEALVNEPTVLFTCENGLADIYPCNGYDLMAHLPLSVFNATSGNDSWGWTDPASSKEYAIMGLDNGTAFVDITNPMESIYLGKLPTNSVSTSWRDIKVYNNHAFIVADNAGTHGMQVFNLTRLRSVKNAPETFTADATFTNVGSCHNIVINENESIAYLVGCDSYDGGVVFIDISNPTNPVELGGYADLGYTHDAQVVTYNGPDPDYIGRDLFFGSNGNYLGSNTVVILDVSDKSNVQFISQVSYPNPGYAHQGWFTDDMSYFIFGDELDEQIFGNNTATFVFDFRDLDAPVLSSTYYGPTSAIDHNGYVKGNSFFLSNYNAGLRVLDITNIGAASNAMTEVGFFDTYPENNNTGYQGVWSVYPFFNSGNIVISDIDRGLFVVKKSDL